MSVVSCLVLITVFADAVSQVLGTLSPAVKQKLDGCLKTALGLPLQPPNQASVDSRLPLASSFFAKERVFFPWPDGSACVPV
jgi:hypothetical protein